MGALRAEVKRIAQGVYPDARNAAPLPLLGAYVACNVDTQGKCFKIDLENERVEEVASIDATDMGGFIGAKPWIVAHDNDIDIAFVGLRGSGGSYALYLGRVAGGRYTRVADIASGLKGWGPLLEGVIVRNALFYWDDTNYNLHHYDLLAGKDRAISTNFGQYWPRPSDKISLATDDVHMLLGRHLAGDTIYDLALYKGSATALNIADGGGSPRILVGGHIVFHDAWYEIATWGGVTNANNKIDVMRWGANGWERVASIDLSAKTGFPVDPRGMLHVLGRDAQGNTVWLALVLNYQRTDGGNTHKLVAFKTDANWNIVDYKELWTSDQYTYVMCAGRSDYSSPLALPIVDTANKEIVAPCVAWNGASKTGDTLLVRIDYSDEDVGEYNAYNVFAATKTVVKTVTKTVTVTREVVPGWVWVALALAALAVLGGVRA